MEASDTDELTSMHSIMFQAGLPRSAVFGDEFERLCGGSSLSLQAGQLWDGNQFVQQPLPFGPMPRLIMAYLNTRALRSQSPEIDVCDSATAFLNMLGKEGGGGPHGTYTTFRKQMLALSACHMTLGITIGEYATIYDGKPIQRFEAWLSNTGEQRTLWPGGITLSHEYFITLKDHAVPLDLRAMTRLAGSALAMDIYAMLAERLHRIESHPIELHWHNLQEEFGHEYSDKNNFKSAFRDGLNKALAVYPKAQVKSVNGGILMMPSPPPVPFRT